MSYVHNLALQLWMKVQCLALSSAKTKIVVKRPPSPGDPYFTWDDVFRKALVDNPTIAAINANVNA